MMLRDAVSVDSDHSKIVGYQMIERIIVSLFILVSSIITISTASAHLLPAQNATLNIEGKSAFFVVSVPVSALENVDDDGNMRLSASEISKNTIEIITQFNKKFLASVNDQRGTIALTRALPPEPEDEIAGTSYIIVMQRIDFPVIPEQLTLSTSLFGDAPGERDMTITATSGDKAEVAILDKNNSIHQFFKGNLSNFLDFIKIGVEHILGGTDHLLFLLTIIVASAGWRYWLAVVTSFTIAHSITLTLSVLEIASIAPEIVEPAIAGSIVVMAALNLWRGAVVEKNTQWIQVLIVFGCGLLHGFGFASAIGETGIDENYRFVTLAGFNLGIEIGQFLFLTIVLIIIALVKRFLSPKIAQQIPRIASIGAAAFGIIFLIDRVGS